MNTCYLSKIVSHASIKNIIISKTADILKSLSSYYTVTAFPNFYVDKVWYKITAKPYKYIGR